jgi:hypothetical protein
MKTPLPVAASWELDRMAAPMHHLVDGDGASLCERVSPEDLVVLTYDDGWADSDDERRCVLCAVLSVL